MVKFLLDENLSYRTAVYLHTLGQEAKTVHEVGLSHTEDERIIQYALEHEYIVITFDIEYGYFFRMLRPHKVGIIVLRLEDQTVESANAALKRLLDDKIFDEEEHKISLVIVDETKIRVRKE